MGAMLPTLDEFRTLTREGLALRAALARVGEAMRAFARDGLATFALHLGDDVIHVDAVVAALLALGYGAEHRRGTDTIAVTVPQ